MRKGVNQARYSEWFRKYVDKFGIRRSEGKLGLLFCKAFDVDDPDVAQLEDDRAAVILIRSHGYLRADLTVDPPYGKEWLTEEIKERYH